MLCIFGIKCITEKIEQAFLRVNKIGFFKFYIIWVKAICTIILLERKLFLCDFIIKLFLYDYSSPFLCGFLERKY